MAVVAHPQSAPFGGHSLLDRMLRIFGDVRPGEGLTTMLMLANIFLILVCYAVIKTVREPLILLGGGAEVRSYAAAGQALLLMGFVPFYSWFSSRVDRVRLLVGVTLFFLVNIELFALAVSLGMPFVGIAFFIWVGIFNISLIAQFWSYANDIFTKDAGDRLFPIIMIGMTLGAPLGSLAAGRLFGEGLEPQVILQLSAVLLFASLVAYLVVNRREKRRTVHNEEPLAKGGGFGLVLRSGYLRLMAFLIILLNIVNTTGEYLIARLLTNQVDVLAAQNPTLDKQAYIGAFTGNYQFWVNVAAFLLQAFVASRLVKHKGLRGALLALPLIAISGYTIIAAGAGFALVRWIKTAENATDYSIMNTARQLLWLPTSREEKYKAKQAIDTFFVRGGDLLSAAIVYFGTSAMLGTRAFAAANVVLTVVWIGIALLLLRRHEGLLRRATQIGIVVCLIGIGAPAFAQEQTRDAELAALQADRAKRVHPYVPTTAERRIALIGRAFAGPPRGLYPFFGSVYAGGGFAAGPGYRAPFAQTGALDVHAAWSIENYKLADISVRLPEMASRRVGVDLRAGWMDAPRVAFHGIGNSSAPENRTSFLYRTTSAGVSGWVRPLRMIRAGAGIDEIGVDSGIAPRVATASNRFTRTHVFAEFDSRQSPGYTRRGGIYRIDWSDYREEQGAPLNFRRFDATAAQFIPLLRENWIIAFRALASLTATNIENEVPYFFLPDLGGSRNLRGYQSWRFRDRNRLLLSGEYRWTAGQFVDMALFVDSGKVAARRTDLDLTNLKTTYGIGVRFHASEMTVLRIELANTQREGVGLVVAFGESF